jgi:hypothetical protein
MQDTIDTFNHLLVILYHSDAFDCFVSLNMRNVH